MNLELIGYEKISDKDKRLSKVNQLKDKIRTELKDIRKSEMHILNTFNNTKLAYKECIFTLFVTYAIEDFIDAPDVFMRANSTYFDDDIIIYTTHIYHINLMLDDEFNFCHHVLAYLRAQASRHYFIGNMLSEENIVKSVISVLDEMVYDSKKSKEGTSIKDFKFREVNNSDNVCPCNNCEKISVECINNECSIFGQYQKAQSESKQKQTITNFENIKSDIAHMAPEEFVEKYYDWLSCDECIYNGINYRCDGKSCKKGIKLWLEDEVDDE